MQVDFCQKCQKQALFLRFRDFVHRVTKPNSYNIYNGLIFLNMKETRKNVLDIESGIKNLSEEQVKEQFHPFVESVARRQSRTAIRSRWKNLSCSVRKDYWKHGTSTLPPPVVSLFLMLFGLFGKQWKKNVPNNGTISCICQKFIVTLQRFCCNK